ncbi:MAG TPA: hypothetical protein PL143_13545 [Rhodocyclaceae bacterium]|nr:hypothetical protein [Rhodocyclaceae bacterium]
MASITHTRPESRRSVRHLDVAAIITELLRNEEDADDLALDEHTLCHLIEADGMIGYDPEVGMLPIGR